MATMNLPVDFKNAVNKMREIFMDLNEENQLLVYGLHKQATTGDCNVEFSDLSDMNAEPKWMAWFSRKGMPKEEAMQLFINKTTELLELQEEVKKPEGGSASVIVRLPSFDKDD